MGEKLDVAIKSQNRLGVIVWKFGKKMPDRDLYQRPFFAVLGRVH